jgi:hypothetical protein
MRWMTKKRRLPQNHLWSPMKILMLRLLLNPLHALSLSERKLIFLMIHTYPI